MARRERGGCSNCEYNKLGFCDFMYVVIREVVDDCSYWKLNERERVARRNASVRSYQEKKAELVKSYKHNYNKYGRIMFWPEAVRDKYDKLLVESKNP